MTLKNTKGYYSQIPSTSTAEDKNVGLDCGKNLPMFVERQSRVALCVSKQTATFKTCFLLDCTV
jgi:hypothetical protein